MSEFAVKQDPESPDVVLNSPDGWFQLQHETGILDEDSGLIVISAKETVLSDIAAAAYVAMQFGCRSETGESRFSKAVLLMPPGHKADSLRAETLVAIQAKMQETGMNEFMIKLLPCICETRSVITLAGFHLVQVISELPPHSACILFCAELYRAEGAGGSPPPNQPRRAHEVARDHLEHLLQGLAAAAQKNKLLLVLLCDKNRIQVGDISPPDEISFIAMSAANANYPEPKSFEIGPLVETFRAGGWSAVKAHSEYNHASEKQIAFALFDAFSMERNLALAWSAMEPYVVQATEMTLGSQLCMSAAALAAGKIKASHELLMQAVTEEIQTAEDLFGAMQLADSHDECELFARMVAQLHRSFPNNPLTLQAEYRRLFKQRDFGAALKLAEQLSLIVETAQCRAFLPSTVNATEFLAEMEKIGELEQGLMSCAEEARFREDYQNTILWAQRIPEGHQLFDRACVVRFQAVRIGFRKGENVPCTTELESLMRIVAVRPNNFTLRAELERLLDSRLEEPLVKVTLSTILAELIERQGNRDDESIEQARSIHAEQDRSAGAQTETEFQEFLEGFQKTMFQSPGGQILVGQGKLDASLAEFVGPTLIRGMAESVVNEGLRENLEAATICLHAICLTSNQAGDPSTDFTVLQSAIDYQASIGAAQQARDLAETALQFWPQSQPKFLSWRISQGWAALAEACLRSGNTLAALRYLCLSLLAHEAPALDVELLRRWYRMAARIFRDLRLTPFAFACIELERNLLTKLDTSGHAVSLEVLELQILLPSLLTSSEDVAAKALEHSENLVQKGEASETFALAGIQASIIRLIAADKVPPDIMNGFRQRLASIPEPLRSRLKATATLTPTKNDVSAIIEALPTAQDHRYLAYQITSSLPALSNALRHAVESDDKELFLMAAGAFAQPSLGVQVANASLSEKAPNASSILRTTTLEGLKSGAFDQVPQFSFSPLGDISIAQLQGCLGASEEVLIIASEPSYQPMGMLVSRESVEGPHPLKAWSTEAFYRWKERYKDDLKWEQPHPNFLRGIDRLGPPVQEISAIVDSLSLGLDHAPQILTILPAAHLFGFTWQLSPHDGGFLVEHSSVGIAPSAAWLVAARTSTWKGNKIRKAWIGSSETKNTTLTALREVVDNCLQEHSFAVSHDLWPFDFAGSEIAFIGAHGGTGMGNYLRSIGDAVNYYSPDEFAQMLAGCGLVILAVCSGGRSDRQSGSEESLGLVAALFRTGVRCVIAPPWPLDFEIMKYWLPAFLNALALGDSAGEAAVKARDAVRQEFDHPCAWGQMHLYGDQSFRPTNITASATD